MSILAFIVLGFIAGLLARAIMPGRQALGMIGTTLIGMLGSLVGGFIGNLISGEPILELNAAGLIGSIIGAIVVLFVTGAGRRAAI